MTIENREHPRAPFRVEIVLECASGKRQARVSDISVGGCFVETILDLNVGDEVKFELVHPNGGRLPFVGAVAYHFVGQGFGVKFSGLTDDQKEFLERITRDAT
jgi:hypothetical protein